MLLSYIANELKIIRLYDAPLKAVWDAWTDPKQAAKWWGPRGFTLTTHSKDFRTGGSWVYTMHGPDGVDYPNKTVYLEVVKHSRLVYDHGANDERPALFRVTVNFSETKQQTKMEMTMTLPTPEAAEETRKFVKKAGGDSTWDRLAEYLVEESTGQGKFFINRSFDAPIDVVYEMWTNPKHLAQWLTPTGSSMKFFRSEIKAGGSSFYVMKTDQGLSLYGRAQYLEVSPPGRIVYMQQFCDENEKVRRHPMAPVWPESMTTSVTLTEEEPSRTRVTIVWEPGQTATPEEIEFFKKARGGMTQGWTGSFDKLEEHVSNLG